MNFKIFNNLNLQDKNSLSRVIIYLFSSSILTYFILFIISILIFRNVDKSDYGLYVVLVSLFAFIELFMGGYNQAISRYLKEKISLIDKQQIILYTVYYKYILLSIFLTLLFILKDNGLLEYLINDYNLVKDIIESFLIIAILNSIISVMIGISNTTLSSLYEYRFVTTIGILRNLIYLISVMGLIFVTNKYLIYLYISLFLNIILLIILSVKINKKFNEFAFFTLIKIKLDLSIYKKYLFSYASPLTAVSLLTYIKNHLPIIILGKEFELEGVAIFSIVKNFFKAMHTLVGSFLGSLTSKFVAMKNDKVKFKKAMNIIYYGTLLVRLSIYILLILVINYIFIIYKLDNTEINITIFYILGLEFFIAGIMTSYGILLQLKTTTKSILYISISRFMIEILLIYFLLFNYGILAAALILLISRYFEIFITYFFIRKENVLRFSFLTITLIFPIVLYFIKKVLN